MKNSSDSGIQFGDYFREAGCDCQTKVGTYKNMLQNTQGYVRGGNYLLIPGYVPVADANVRQVRTSISCLSFRYLRYFRYKDINKRRVLNIPMGKIPEMCTYVSTKFFMT